MTTGNTIVKQYRMKDGFQGNVEGKRGRGAKGQRGEEGRGQRGGEAKAAE
jgi:hypothetical protein